MNFEKSTGNFRNAVEILFTCIKDFFAILLKIGYMSEFLEFGFR